PTGQLEPVAREPGPQLLAGAQVADRPELGAGVARRGHRGQHLVRLRYAGDDPDGDLERAVGAGGVGHLHLHHQRSKTGADVSYERSAIRSAGHSQTSGVNSSSDSRPSKPAARSRWPIASSGRSPSPGNTRSASVVASTVVRGRSSRWTIGTFTGPSSPSSSSREPPSRK